MMRLNSAIMAVLNWPIDKFDQFRNGLWIPAWTYRSGK